MKKGNTFLSGGTIEEQRKKKTLFSAICITFAVLLVLLTVLIVSLALPTDKDTDPQGSDEPTISIGQTKNDVLGENAMYTGNLLILNDSSSYRGTPEVESIQDYEDRPKLDDGKTNSYTVRDKSACVTNETIVAFNQMAKAFYEKTKNEFLIVSGAYNDDADGVFSAGTAISLQYYHDYSADTTDRRDLVKEGDYAWIYNNAVKYGFINVLVDGQASNIFRYVGVEHANAIRTNGGTVEQYVNYLRANTSAENPISVKSGTTTYAVYYLNANGELLFPASYSYTVSGDNKSGYIVTVKLTSSAGFEQ